METGTWRLKQIVQYATFMLYHNIQNSDEDGKIEQLIKKLEKKLGITFYQNVISISDELGIEISSVKTKKESR